MAIALILMIFPMLIFGYFFFAEALAQPNFGVMLAAATVMLVGFVAWIRFLTMEKYLEDEEIGHDDDHLGPVATEPEPEEIEEHQLPLAA